jgi:hypothetical protein
MDINYDNKLVSKAYDTKFIRIYVDNILSWNINLNIYTQIKYSFLCSLIS